MLGTPEPTTHAHRAGTIGLSVLRIAIVDCICDGLDLPTIRDRLWREDPEAIESLYDRLRIGRGAVFSEPRGRIGLHVERMRRMRRPLPSRPMVGVTVTAIADQAGLARETLACMLEHHGYLEMVPYGGRQSRRLVTDRAYAAGLGHNVDSSATRIARLEGAAKACVFPVFYPEKVPAILWTLDHDGIRREVAAQPSKRHRLTYLLQHHPYLPTNEIAALSGFTRQGVDKRKLHEGSAAPPRWKEVPQPPSRADSKQEGLHRVL